MNRPPSKWVNTEPDPGLPHALLVRLTQRLPVTTIEEVWLFPTRRIAAGESTIFLVAAFEPEPDKRRVITARYTVARDRKGGATVQEHIEEHGIAPAAAVTRIVNGVLHRLDEAGEQPPRAERIERDPERWWALIEELGGQRPSAPEAAAEPPPETRPEPTPESATSAGDVERAAGPIDDENEIDYQ